MAKPTNGEIPKQVDLAQKLKIALASSQATVRKFNEVIEAKAKAEAKAKQPPIENPGSVLVPP